MHKLINADCLEYLKGREEQWTTIFADRPRQHWPWLRHIQGSSR